jgi:hypothetical protein
MLFRTQLCGSVRNASKFTVKPTYSTVVKGCEKAEQPLKLTISTLSYILCQTCLHLFRKGGVEFMKFLRGAQYIQVLEPLS